MKTNEIQMFARIAALQFDKLYKAMGQSADLIQHSREFYRAYRVTGCTVGEFEMLVYNEYAKI